MNYLKSIDFPIHLMGYWWLLWIALSLTPLNEFIAPSGATIFQFLFLISSFLLGHATIKWNVPINSFTTIRFASGFNTESARIKWTLGVSISICLAMLLLSLSLAGAFSTSFFEYFAQMRLIFAEGGQPTLTGIRVLDVLTKILVFPLSYTIAVTLLAIEISTFKRIFFLALTNFLLFSYLWQVNYPFIHLFWFLIFYILITAQRRGRFNVKILAAVALLFIGLAASAANRFGGDILGGLQRYIFGYHLIGFSYYDHQYHDAHSILHQHSFGRSSLGFLDQMLEALIKPLGLGYRAASFESAAANEIPLDIGAYEIREFNAFGTILFSLYRDFHFIGIFIGGFLYGALATYMRYRSQDSWRCGALLLMLASAWMMGMMVTPLEEAYFWFVIVALGLAGLINRGFRW